MGSHWSAFVPNVTGKQAYALDNLAESLGMSDGMALLMHVTGDSRSKIGKSFANYAYARRTLDTAFALRRP